MSLLRRTLIAASESDTLERQVTTRSLTRRIAMRFIAGETLEDGIGVVREVARR